MPFGMMLPASTKAPTTKPLPYPPQMDEAQTEIYKSTESVDLKMWIYTPDGHSEGDNRPAAVFFFGGGWLQGSPLQFRHQCAYLAARGMVAIAADYRVMERDGATVNVCVSDAKSAIRWVRNNAGQLGIDPNRIAAAGGSAGGHLAVSTATLPGHDDPQDDLSISAHPNALILFNPVVLMNSVPDKLILPLEWFDLIDGRLGADPESLSPYQHIRPDMGPAIIFHGMADQLVPYETVSLFRDAMTAQGNRCDLIGYKDALHGFFNYGRLENAAFADTLNKVDSFLVGLGYLDGVEAVRDGE